MTNEKGQMKILAGIIVLLLVVGVIIWTQFFSKPKEVKPAEAVKKEEPQKAEKGFFEQLFGGAKKETAGSPAPKQGFFDQLFGGGGGKTTTPSSQGGFFDQLYSGSGTKIEVSQNASAPKISDGSPASDLPAETRKAILSVKTDKIAICKYGPSSGLSYDAMQGVFSQTNSTSHSTEVTGLSEGTAYKYYIKCASQSGIKNTEDYLIFFKVLAPKDTVPPIVRNPSHAGDLLPSNSTSTVISVSTDEQADCRYSFVQGVLYRSMGKQFTHYDQSKRFHVSTITGLQKGKTYEYFVRCQDLAGNANIGDVMISFQIGQ